MLELKRLQIRTSKANEAVLVKRTIDEYNKSSLSNVGLGPYNNTDFSFSSFEKFLYESLRKLQKSGKKHLDNLPLKPFDFDYGESDLYKMSAIPDNPCLCTSKTHRCYHAVHAYTGIPCSAYSKCMNVIKNIEVPINTEIVPYFYYVRFMNIVMLFQYPSNWITIRCPSLQQLVRAPNQKDSCRKLMRSLHQVLAKLTSLWRSHMVLSGN